MRTGKLVLDPEEFICLNKTRVESVALFYNPRITVIFYLVVVVYNVTVGLALLARFAIRKLLSTIELTAGTCQNQMCLLSII